MRRFGGLEGVQEAGDAEKRDDFVGTGTDREGNVDVMGDQ